MQKLEELLLKAEEILLEAHLRDVTHQAIADAITPVRDALEIVQNALPTLVNAVKAWNDSVKEFDTAGLPMLDLFDLNKVPELMNMAVLAIESLSPKPPQYRQMMVRFERYNDQDTESAEANFPGLFKTNPGDAYYKQFLAELDEATEGGKLGQHIVYHYQYTTPTMWVYALFDTNDELSVNQFAERLQKILYDEGGMTGNFRIIDAIPPRQNDFPNEVTVR